MIELLIAMAMASVVFMIVGSLLATFVTQNTKSQRQELFEQAKNDLALELSNYIRWGQDIQISGSILTVDGNIYRVENGNFLKNDQNLISSKLGVTSFEIEDRSAAPGLVSLEMTIGLEDRGYPLASDVMHLVVSQRKTDIDF